MRDCHLWQWNNYLERKVYMKIWSITWMGTSTFVILFWYGRFCEMIQISCVCIRKREVAQVLATWNLILQIRFRNLLSDCSIFTLFIGLKLNWSRYKRQEETLQQKHHFTFITWVTVDSKCVQQSSIVKYGKVVQIINLICNL